MDDLISRQTLMKEFSDFVRASNNSDFVRTPTWNDAVSLVESIPPAQLDIILCPNCRYNDGTAYCELHYRDVKAKDFCSWAERRE